MAFATATDRIYETGSAYHFIECHVLAELQARGELKLADELKRRVLGSSLSELANLSPEHKAVLREIARAAVRDTTPALLPKGEPTLPIKHTRFGPLDATGAAEVLNYV